MCRVIGRKGHETLNGGDRDANIRAMKVVIMFIKLFKQTKFDEDFGNKNGLKRMIKITYTQQTECDSIPGDCEKLISKILEGNGFKVEDTMDNGTYEDLETLLSIYI